MVKPTEVPSGAFAFCRWSLAVLLWAALLLHQPGLVALCAAILAVSAVLQVGRAPMIVLWKRTGHRLFPSLDVVLDARAMRFAHTVGALLCAVAFVLLLVLPRTGLVLLVAVTIAKTIGAAGFCTATRLYECATSGMRCCGTVGRRDV